MDWPNYKAETDFKKRQTNAILNLKKRWKTATCRSSVENLKLFVPLVNALFFLCFKQIAQNIRSFCSSCWSQGNVFCHTGRNFLTVVVVAEAVGSWSWLLSFCSDLSPSFSGPSSSFSGGSTALLFSIKIVSFCCRFISFHNEEQPNCENEHRWPKATLAKRQNAGSSLSRNCVERLTQKVLVTARF